MSSLKKVLSTKLLNFTNYLYTLVLLYLKQEELSNQENTLSYRKGFVQAMKTAHYWVISRSS